MRCFVIALITSGSLMSFAPFALADEYVKLEQVSPSARKTIEREVGKDKIAKIERATEGGRVYYEVYYDRDGKHTELYVSEDGRVLKHKPDDHD